MYEYKEIDKLIFFKLRISVYTHKKTSKRKQMSWQVDHWSKSVSNLVGTEIIYQIAGGCSKAIRPY